MKSTVRSTPCLAVILFFLSTGTLFSQAAAPRQVSREKIDSRVWSQSYWIAKAKDGLVPLAAPAATPPATRGSSTISVPRLINMDSPDVPVSDDTTITQSENSVFVNPVNVMNLLNSNNSTSWPVSVLYGSSGFFTSDGGASWAGSEQGTGGSNSGDPAAVIDRAERFFVGYIAPGGGQGIARSTNHGTTWTAGSVANGGAGFLDKNHLWVDNATSSPYEGNLYSAWTNFGGANDADIELARSTDHGVTWSAPVNVSDAVNAGSHNQGVNIQTGPNGEVYAVWAIYDSWPSDETAIGFAKSTNGGVSFSPAVRIISNIRGIRMSATSKNMRVASFPVAAVDISGGTMSGAIYVVWTNIGVPGVNTGYDRDGYLIRSTDGGANWSSPVRINQDPAGLGNEHFFQWVTCDPSNGFLSVIFYDDRNTNPTAVETFVSNSTNGGVTWVDFKVSDVAFTPSPIPGLAGGYFGDYLGISARSGRVYPAWTDNRDGRAMTYVSAFTVEADSIPPSAVADLAAGSPTSNTVTLNWTAPGDNGDTGTASFYDIRYSTDPITDGNFALASAVGNAPVPAPSGTPEELEVWGLDFNTGYFFAMKALDEWQNPSGLSNLASATTLGIPVAAVNPSSLADSLLTGETSVKIVFLRNDGEGTLDFEVSDFQVPASIPKAARQNADLLNSDNFIAPDKGTEDPRRGAPVVSGSGGPDSSGYTWIDSDEPDGPAFDWTEISSIGTPVFLTDDTYSIVPLPFSFPFHGADRTSIALGSNGILMFGAGSSTPANTPIPDASAPNDFLAPFWTDLNPGVGGMIYTWSDTAVGRFIVEFSAVPHFSGVGTFTFQVVLWSSGRIECRYLSMSSLPSGYTVGLENASGTDGLQVAFNTSYLHDNLAIRFVNRPDFLDVSPSSGRIDAGDSLALDVTMDAAGLFGGDYQQDIAVHTNDPDLPVLTIAASLHVTGAPDIALSPDTLDYGHPFIGYPDTLFVHVVNSGTDTLSVDSIRSASTLFSVAGTGAFALRPFSHADVPVIFLPETTDPVSTALSVFSNDADEPVDSIRLVGTGIHPPDIAVSPDSLQRELFTGDRRLDTVTIFNNGLSDLTYAIEAEEETDSPPPPPPLNPVQGRPSPSPTTPSTEETASGTPHSFASVSSVHLPFSESFEDGNYNGWTDDWGTGTREVTNATAAAGSYSFRYENSSTGHFQGIHQDFDSASRPGYIRFHVRAASNTTASCYFVLVGDAFDTEVIWFFADPGGHFYVNGDVGGDFSVPYNPNQWYRIEYKNIDWDLKRFDYYVDGVLVKAGIPFRNAQFVSQFQRLYLYNVYPAEAWWDGIRIGGTEWLTDTPSEGTIPAGSSQQIVLTLDAAGLPGGDYASNLNISSNDPDERTTLIPVRLHVLDAPQIAVSPDSLGFGGVFIGYPETLSVAISNEGTDSLSVSGMTISNPRFTATVTFPVTVPPGSQVHLPVAFAPTSPVPESGTLDINNNDPTDATVTVTLGGTGVHPPVVGVHPDSLYENLYSGFSATDTVVIGNTGLGDLQYGIDVVATAALAPSRTSVRQGISAGPATAGRRPVVPAGVTDDDEPFDLETAAGEDWPVSPGLAVPLPFSDSFEDGDYDGWTVDWGSGTREVTTATAAVGSHSFRYENSTVGHIQGIHQDFDSGSRPEYVSFHVRASSNSLASCYFVLVGDVYDTEVIWFYATPGGFLYVNGNVGGDISVPYDPDQWYRIEYKNIDWDLKQFDYYVDGALIKTAIPFRNADYVNQFSRLYLYNYSPTEAWWDGISLGAAADWLTVAPTGGSVPPGDSAKLAVTFNGTGLLDGDYFATIRIASNDPEVPEYPVNAHFRVIGVPEIDVQPGSLDYDTVYALGHWTDTIVVWNPGTKTLDVTSLISDDSTFSPDTGPFSLAPGHERKITMTFSPPSAGSYTGTLAIASNDTSDPVVNVPLRGIAIPPPVIAYSPDSFYFHPEGMDSAEAPLVIRNNGLNPLFFRVTIGESPTQVAASAQEPGVVAPVPHAGTPAREGGVVDSGTGVLFTATGTPYAPGAIASVPVPYNESFEDGNYDGWAVDYGLGTREVTDATSAHGSRSFRYLNQWYGHYQGIHQDFEAGGRPTAVGFYVRASSNSSASCYFVLVGDANNTEVIWFFGDPSGHFYVNGDVGGDFSVPYNPNQWYRIEYRNIDWDLKRFDYYVDGALIKASIPFRNPSLVNQFYRLYVYNYYPTEAWWDGISIGSSWLSVAPDSGSIAPGDSLTLDVKVRTEGLDDFDYLSSITLNSNDPVNPASSIPVRLMLDPPVFALDRDTVRVGLHAGDTVTTGLTLSNSGASRLRYTVYADTERASFGDTLVPVPSNYEVRGGIFTVAGPTKLRSIEMFLNVPQPTGLLFRIFESLTPGGLYWESMSFYQPVDAGRGIYGSGPFEFILQPGKFYFIGVQPGNPVTFYRNAQILPVVDHGVTLEASAYSSTGTPPFVPNRVFAFPVWERLQVEPLIASVTPGSGIVNAAEAGVVLVKVAGNHPPGNYLTRLVIRTNDPAAPRTDVTLLTEIRGATATPPWDLISLPYDGGDNRKKILFPATNTPAWAYHSSYIERETLMIGEGYWLKLAPGDGVPQSGTVVIPETLDVARNWNLIGTGSGSVPGTGVTGVPPVVIISDIIGFSEIGGYFSAGSLVPGSGYWIKVNQAGKIVLRASTAAAPVPSVARVGLLNSAAASDGSLSAIVLTDGSHRSAVLYFSTTRSGLDPARFELPPVPPTGVFDIRFSSGRSYESLEDSPTASGPRVIDIQGTEGPLRIGWDSRPADAGSGIEIRKDGRLIAIHPFEGEGSIELPETGGITLALVRHADPSALIPVAFGLDQNFPNPFNPSTTIRYQIPVGSRVSVRIFNILGEEVARPVDGIENAGYKVLTWNAANFPSGVYFYRIEAVSTKDPSSVFVESRKMMLLR